MDHFSQEASQEVIFRLSLSGLLKARAGFGPTITFLFTSPLMNPIIIGLFLATFGLKVTVVYFVIALVVSVIGGYTLEKLGFEKYVRKGFVGDSSCGARCGDAKPVTKTTTTCGSISGCDTLEAQKDNRWARISAETWKQFKKVLPALMIGVAIGSFTYGFVPADLIAQFADPDNPFAILVAAVIGVPLYVRAEAVIPLAAALDAKGMGELMALIIGGAGAILTEVILLKGIFRNQMIAAFLFVIFTMAVPAGLIFSII